MKPPPGAEARRDALDDLVADDERRAAQLVAASSRRRADWSSNLVVPHELAGLRSSARRRAGPMSARRPGRRAAARPIFWLDGPVGVY